MSDYFRAVGRGDGGEICSRLSPRAQEDIATLQGKPCPRAMTEAARELPESLNAYEILGETVDRDIARVRVRGLGADERISLRRFGTAWRITDAPGLGL